MFYVRLLPLLAFYLCLAALAFSLTTLLVGVTGDYPRVPAMATFNTSSLGLAEYHDPSSPTFMNITSLTPSDLIDPPSITAYLGAKDWYTMHYLSICSGFWAPSTSDPSLLTSTKIKVVCTRQTSGYTFNLSQILASELLPNVQGLLADVPITSYRTNIWTNCWYTGIGNCVLACLCLPFALSGKRRCVNEVALVQAFISFVCFITGSGLATHKLLEIHHWKGPLGPNPYPGKFLNLTWLSSVCMVLVFCLEWQEFRFERATSFGERITTYGKLWCDGWFARRQQEQNEMPSLDTKEVF